MTKALDGQPNARQVMLCPFPGLGLAQPEHLHGRLHDVFKHCHVAPQVEMLKDHRQLGAQSLQLTSVSGLKFPMGIRNELQTFACHADAALVGVFEQIDAA